MKSAEGRRRRCPPPCGNPSGAPGFNYTVPSVARVPARRGRDVRCLSGRSSKQSAYSSIRIDESRGREGRKEESPRSRSLAVIEFLGPVPSTAGDPGLVGSILSLSLSLPLSPLSLSFWVGRGDHEVACQVGVLSVAHRNSTSPYYIAPERGKRYLPLYT